MVKFRLVVKYQERDRDGNCIIAYVRESITKADLLRFHEEAKEKTKEGYRTTIEYLI